MCFKNTANALYAHNSKINLQQMIELRKKLLHSFSMFARLLLAAQVRASV